MRILLGVQARSGGSRFPGKIYEEIEGRSILQRVVDACLRVDPLPKAIQVSTAILCPENDDRLMEECRKNKWDRIAGSEEDLIARYQIAIEISNADACVRLTADCPFLSSKIISEVVMQLAQVDYCSNTIYRSWAEGLDVQGASKKAWDWLDNNQQVEREHPWKLFDENQIIRDQFVKDGLDFFTLCDFSNIIFQKTSIDTKEDLESARTFKLQHEWELCDAPRPMRQI